MGIASDVVILVGNQLQLSASMGGKSGDPQAGNDLLNSERWSVTYDWPPVLPGYIENEKNCCNAAMQQIPDN